MTISSEVRKAGPFLGNGITTDFPFTFKVFSVDQVFVTLMDAAGVEHAGISGADYTVALNADQNTMPGGTVATATPPAPGTRLTITSRVPNLQHLDLTNQGGFYPTTINQALDRATIQIQQLAERASRAVSFPVSDSDPAPQLPSAMQRKGAVLAFDEAGMPIAGPAINAIGAVLTAIQDIHAVAGIAADIPVVADNVADITNFSHVYLGAREAAPTTRSDGTPLQPGDLYFNTTTNAIRVYSGTAWGHGSFDLSSAQDWSFKIGYTPGTYAGQTEFPGLSLGGGTVDVFYNGALLYFPDDYTYTNSVLTLSRPVAAQDVLVVYNYRYLATTIDGGVYP